MNKLYLLHILTVFPFLNAVADNNAVADSKNNQPNVILVLTDDQGYGDLHCHGNPIIQTPCIDKMYKESVRFSNFHVNATSAPSRSAIMTGRYARRVGVWHTVMGRSFLRKDETTIADVFSANGYYTAMLGKWHLGTNYPLRPIDRGFNEMWLGGGGCTSQVDDYWDNDHMNDYFNHNGVWEKLEGFSTDALFTKAFKIMEKSKSESKPFFVYLPLAEPHGPCNTLSEWDKPYLDAGLDIDLANFFATITRIDYNMGRLDKFLKEQKLDKNTIVIFMTDNGSASASHYYNAGMKGCKGTMYEGGHRVPFFMKIPKACKNVDRTPRNITKLSAHIDILPTLVEMCNLHYSYKNNLDGKSLVPLLQNCKIWEDRTIFLDQQRRHYARKGVQSCMMTEQWRLINGNELYDIKKDLAQKYNVYAEHPEVVAKLKKAYDTYWEDFVDYDEKSQFTRQIIGSDNQKEVLLSPIDLFTENTKVLLCMQFQVRDGDCANGSWFVDIEKDGLYEFELRRWPKELDKCINDSIPEVTSEQNDINLNRWGWKFKGKALNIVRARLSVNEQDVTREVTDSDKSVIFTLPLKKGKATVRSWFYDTKDQDRCPYYVYVRLKSKL